VPILLEKKGKWTMNKIKVMHVVSDSKFGGAGKYLVQICKYIDKNRFQIIVVVPKGSLLTTIIGQIDNINIIEIDGINAKSFSFLGLRRLVKVMKEIRPDIIHSHACLSARVAAYLRGINKVFYTRHSLLPEIKGLKKLVKVSLSRILSNRVIAVSKAVKKNLIAEGERKEDIYLVYNGVELPRKSYDVDKLKDKYNISKEDIIITLVGRLDPVKGQDHMLKITELLKEKAEAFTVVFAGDGSNRTKLEDYAREKELPVVFLGHVNAIDEIYSLSDIIVNTSNSEALSFAALEAFSHKKPVVAFDIDGINEVIDDGVDGYLVDFMDYEDFSEKLLKLMEDKGLRTTLGENAFEKVKTKFTVEEMVKQIENIYGGI